ncbi:MAG: hypothetical protein PHS41_07890, partial [Victivallaceae bacterium]|nr:hypothetical protein [Victivallaceae bacterium]
SFPMLNTLSLVYVYNIIRALKKANKKHWVGARNMQNLAIPASLNKIVAVLGDFQVGMLA